MERVSFTFISGRGGKCAGLLRDNEGIDLRGARLLDPVGTTNSWELVETVPHGRANSWELI
jgi:hypothetical protein